jgi:hypothetical protein
LRSRCQRTATCTAVGAPAVAARAYSVERSRATTLICGRRRSHAATLAPERSGRRSRGLGAPSRRGRCRRCALSGSPSRRCRRRAARPVRETASRAPGAARDRGLPSSRGGVRDGRRPRRQGRARCELAPEQAGACVGCPRRLSCGSRAREDGSGLATCTPSELRRLLDLWRKGTISRTTPSDRRVFC